MNKLFDLRLIIALLFAVFGLVVTVAGLVANGSVSASGESVGVNVNLWTGIPMLVVAALFAGWALARPVEMPAQQDDSAQRPETGRR